jgi:chorismate-pyruvate lyase
LFDTTANIDLLYPLSRFYREAGKGVPDFAIIAGADMPQPFRDLLVHERDMTSTLERFHNDSIYLRILHTDRDADHYERQVVLQLNRSDKPVEYGAVEIDLGQFPSEARELILGNHRPLGSILANFAIPYRSKPEAFFRTTADAFVRDALNVAEGTTLYGRRNILSTPKGQAIAHVVEIVGL